MPNNAFYLSFWFCHSDEGVSILTPAFLMQKINTKWEKAIDGSMRKKCGANKGVPLDKGAGRSLSGKHIASPAQGSLGEAVEESVFYWQRVSTIGGVFFMYKQDTETSFIWMFFFIKKRFPRTYRILSLAPHMFLTLFLGEFSKKNQHQTTMKLNKFTCSIIQKPFFLEKNDSGNSIPKGLDFYSHLSKIQQIFKTSN